MMTNSIQRPPWGWAPDSGFWKIWSTSAVFRRLQSDLEVRYRNSVSQVSRNMFFPRGFAARNATGGPHEATKNKMDELEVHQLDPAQ